MADDAPDPWAAIPLQEEAVAAARRKLGPEVFEEDAGHFWLALETRPGPTIYGATLPLWAAT